MIVGSRWQGNRAPWCTIYHGDAAPIILEKALPTCKKNVAMEHDPFTAKK
jgi:hypothetical protein